MARLLQKSNQPSANANSWPGFLSCCFASPRTSSPEPLKVPTIKVQPPQSVSDNKGSVAERDPADGHSVTSHTRESPPPRNQAALSAGVTAPSSNQAEAKLRASTRVEDVTRRQSRPSSQNVGEKSNHVCAEEMYNSWVGKGSRPPSESHENVTLATLADRRSGAHTPKSQHSPPDSVGPTSMQEFAEEAYPKGYNWQTQSDQTPHDTVILPANTIIHTHIKVDYKASDLIIKVNKVDNAPSEDRAGSQAYQVHIAVLGLKKKKRWHSRIIPAPNPVFDETAVFKGMTPDELAKAALRLRLYGCRKLRRHFIFAESVVAFAALNLRSGEADIPFALASKVGSESVVDSDSDTADNLSRLNASRLGSRLSLHSRASKRSTISRASNSQSRGPPSVATTDLPELETARQVAEGREANWPEMLCGLAYNVTTKRLNIHVLRASRLKVPETPLRTPKAHVALTLVSQSGEKITSSHTHDVKLSANTEFGERFAFDMSSLNPREVTLFVRIFQKHHVHKNECLGWFAIGSKNTGEEERSHWNEMLQAQGQEITRWHVLNENLT